MLDFIEGQILSKQPQSVVLQVGGMGFRLFVSNQTLDRLPAVGVPALVYVHLHVREDELSLFGFGSQEEREFFNLLIQISGVGPKLALAVLSGCPVATLKKALLFGDEGPLVSIPGIGKKTAQRLILELKDKVGKLSETGLADLPDGGATGGAAATLADNRSQAVEALMALGYSAVEAYKVLPMDETTAGKDVEELIRLGLQKLARF